MGLKIKVILSAIGAALLFIIGLFTGRAGRHNESRIAAAIDGEGELQDDISSAQSGERDAQDRIDIVESGINATSAGISDLEAGISDTDRLAERLKKRNNLE